MTTNQTTNQWARWEAYFFNHGANIIFWTLIGALNVVMATWGAWEFTAPRWTTNDDILRVTLPIARASGRVVTFNSALIFTTGCKFFWTWVRTTHIQLGFPVDNIMPNYHRIIALTIIVMGGIFHTIPQVVNYATKSLPINNDLPIWNFGEGLSTLSLLISGIMLVVLFAVFFVSTLERFRLTTVGFRLFWWAHILGIVCAIPLLLVHGTFRGTPIALYFMVGPVVLYLMDSFLRRWYFVERKSDVVQLTASHDGGERVVKLVVRNSNFTYSPGQYVELKIPQLAWHEWHPFTIASEPNDRGDITFYIKSVGRWTNALYAFAKLSNDDGEERQPAFDTVCIRGPYGAPAQNYLAYRHIVVIGSGIGVTPLLSIWKHLVANAATSNSSTTEISEKKEDVANSHRSSQREHLPDEIESTRLLRESDVSYVGFENFEQSQHKSGRLALAFYASLLESMTVNICLFVFAFTIETLVFCIFMFPNDERIAAGIEIFVGTVVLGVFGLKIVLSGLAYGLRYFRSFVFLLELAILVVESVAFAFALALFRSPDDQEKLFHFLFFGFFLFLHSVRMFHIFYAVSNPSTSDATLLRARKTEAGLKSITGIWVSQHYSSMSYAAPDLVDSVRDLGPTFSLQLFATRDKQEDLDSINPFGAARNHALTAGRPDWDAIFSDALERAHASNADGEAVGVFFCGSPAIAHTLHLTAQRVTAEYQYFTNNASRCRILVHKENF